MAQASFDSKGRLTCSIDQLHTLVQEKMLGKIQTGGGMRGAFKVFGPSPEGIGLARFRQMLRTIGLTLNEKDALRLFAKYDDDGSGHIDMYELMRNLLPADYSKQTWQAKNFETQLTASHNRNNVRKRMGAKYHSATHFPKGLRSQMEPTRKDVEKMIRFKIESNARDGCERGYALKMFNRPINGISRSNLQRALQKHSIPCSDNVLDEIFDSLQVCGLIAFDRLWHCVMPVDGRVTIGNKTRNPNDASYTSRGSKHRPLKGSELEAAKIKKELTRDHVGEMLNPVDDVLNRSKRRRKKREKSHRSGSRASKRSHRSRKGNKNGLPSSQSLPSLGTGQRSRSYSMAEIKKILFERITSHHNAEVFCMNCFDRNSEISFRVFCNGLKKLGVPATKKQANVLFGQYDSNHTGLVNHRTFYRDVADYNKGSKMGWVERRTNNALYEQQRGWTPPEQRQRLPQVNIRIQTSSSNQNHRSHIGGKKRKQHTNISSMPMPETKSQYIRPKKKKGEFYNVIYKKTSIW